MDAVVKKGRVIDAIDGGTSLRGEVSKLKERVADLEEGVRNAYFALSEGRRGDTLKILKALITFGRDETTNKTKPNDPNDKELA
jgi:hypothetical protein